jgi:hypothetical protein
MAAKTLAELRVLVRERGGFLAGDPAYPDGVIDRQINIAQAGLLSANANGWWWNHVEFKLVNPAGADVEYFEPIISFGQRSTHVYGVFVSLDNDFWVPVEQRTLEDADRLTGGRVTSDGIPLAYTAVQRQGADVTFFSFSNTVLRFAPPLPAAAWVRYIVVPDVPDLVNAGDVSHGWPDLWIDALVEAAAAALARQRRTLGSLNRRSMLSLQKAHQAAADEWVKALLRYAAKPYEGPAYGPLVRSL